MLILRKPWYAGEYMDSETGLVYLRARYYQPTTGRFLTEDTHWNPQNSIYGDNPVQIREYKDPLGRGIYTYRPDINAICQSTNRYLYCGNNPIMYVDQNGEVFMLVTGAIGAVLGGIGGTVYSYAKHGEVHWQNVAEGAAIGGAVGLTGGAAAGALLAGSATASTGAVIAGASATVAVGGTGATVAVAKTVDYLVQNAENLKRTATVAGEVAQRAYINSTLTIQQIMQSANPVKDAYLQNGLKWMADGTFNGSKGIYELVIDVDTQTIVHYLFRSVN